MKSYERSLIEYIEFNLLLNFFIKSPFNFCNSINWESFFWKGDVNHPLVHLFYESPDIKVINSKKKKKHFILRKARGAYIVHYKWLFYHKSFHASFNKLKFIYRVVHSNLSAIWNKFSQPIMNLQRRAIWGSNGNLDSFDNRYDLKTCDHL